MTGGLPYNPLKNMMNGQPTSCFSNAGEITGDNSSDIQKAIEYAKSSVEQAITNVTAFSAAKLGQTTAELLAPPNPADILAKASEKVGAYLISPGDIMKELLKPAEEYDENLRNEALNEAVDSFTKFKDEKLTELNDAVSGVVDFITVEMPNITKKAIQGTKWVDEQVKYYEALATDQINKNIDDNTKFLFDAKQSMVDSLSDGIANQTAAIANEEVRKNTKRKLDKIKEVKEKAIVTAKANAGAALLNLMAKIGM